MRKRTTSFLGTFLIQPKAKPSFISKANRLYVKMYQVKMIYILKDSRRDSGAKHFNDEISTNDWLNLLYGATYSGGGTLNEQNADDGGISSARDDSISKTSSSSSSSSSTSVVRCKDFFTIIGFI